MTATERAHAVYSRASKGEQAKASIWSWLSKCTGWEWVDVMYEFRFQGLCASGRRCVTHKGTLRLRGAVKASDVPQRCLNALLLVGLALPVHVGLWQLQRRQRCASLLGLGRSRPTHACAACKPTLQEQALHRLDTRQGIHHSYASG